MSLSQQQIDAINAMNQDFQNIQLGTLLAQAINGTLPSLSISTAEIDDLAISTAKIADAAVTNAKLGSDVKVGSLAALNTSSKTDIVTALNEVLSGSTTSLSTKIDETSEIKNIFSGSITLNGVNPTGVKFNNATAATVTSTNSETFDLTSVGDGGTIILNPNGEGNKTATINAAAGYSYSGATPSTDISAGVDNKFNISVDGDSAEEVTLTLTGLTSGAAIATQMQTQIQALGGNKASVTVDYDSTAAGKYAIVSPTLGTDSAIVITPATLNNITEELKIGTASGGTEAAGTGDVADLSAVTAQEIVDVINGDAGTWVTAEDSSGNIKITSDVTGVSSSIVMGAGTLNTLLGFTGSAAYYGAQGLSMGGDMANTNYRVLPVLSGVAAASLADLGLSITNKATDGFTIECETTSSTATVDLFIVGQAA